MTIYGFYTSLAGQPLFRELSLAYVADIVKPVYADCRAEWEDDLETKHRVWDLFRAAPPPLGFDFGTIFESAGHPDFGLLKLTPWRIELADAADKENRRVWLP